MKSPIVKRSVVLNGHKTSISMEDIFWSALKNIATESGVSVSQVIAGIDKARRTSNLSSSLRTFVLAHYIKRCGDTGILPDMDHQPAAITDENSEHGAAGQGDSRPLRNAGSAFAANY